MARPTYLLTPISIMTLPAKRHSDGGGLYLQVLPGGTRSWLFNYTLHGKQHWMGLGTVNPSRLGECLSEARRRAALAREQLRSGQDPLALKREQAALLEPVKATSFGDCAAAYLAKHSASWKSPIHARQWKQCLDDYVLPIIGRMPVADVGAKDVKRVLEPLWETRREVARKLAGKVDMVLRFAIASEYRTAPSPASLKIMRTVLGPLQQKPKHHPALPWKEMPDFMRKIEQRDDVPALALQWLIFTATRSSEARGCRWSELDRAKGLWTLPPARMKGGQQHVVPISPAAGDVLDKVQRRHGVDHVFCAQGSDPVSETSLRNLLRECGVDKRTGSLHGFRSTFRDWCAEFANVADDVGESCLAHQVPDAVVKAYKRATFLEARTQVMSNWGYYLSL